MLGRCWKQVHEQVTGSEGLTVRLDAASTSHWGCTAGDTFAIVCLMQALLTHCAVSCPVYAAVGHLQWLCRWVQGACQAFTPCAA